MEEGGIGGGGRPKDWMGGRSWGREKTVFSGSTSLVCCGLGESGGIIVRYI